MCRLLRPFGRSDGNVALDSSHPASVAIGTSDGNSTRTSDGLQWRRALAKDSNLLRSCYGRSIGGDAH